MIHHFPAVSSTNTVAVQMAANGADNGTVVYADQQTGGRGRAGRIFVSPVGGLYFSLILRMQLDVIDVPLITLAAGVGLCTGLAQSGYTNIRVKWPNDLYLHDRKLGGILTESSPFRPGIGPEFVVVGAGINVKTAQDQFPDSLRSSVISLEQEDEREGQVGSLLQPLTGSILTAVHQLAHNREELLAQWRTYDYLLNRKVYYESTNGLIKAVGRGLADDGRYIVCGLNGEEHHVVAGDINPVQLTHP